MHKLLPVFLVFALALSMVSAASADGASESVVYRINRTYDLANNSSNSAENTELSFYAFDNREGWASQSIIAETIAPGTSREILSNKDNRIVHVNLGEIGPYETESVSTTYQIRVDTVDLDLSSQDVSGDIPPQYSEYTESVPGLWQSDDPQIEAVAKELTDGVVNYYSKVENIIDFVMDNISYEVQSREHGAVWALNHTEGDCTEFTNLLIALCRASGVPSKVVSGYLPFTDIYGRTSNELGKSAHQWAIVYLPSTGWVPVDLTYVFQGNPQFGELTNDHLVELTSDGNNWVKDSEISVPSVSWNYSYFGAKPDLEFSSSGTVTREIAVETRIQSPIKKYSDRVEVTVKATNRGVKNLDGLEVEVLTDNSYFEIPPVRDIQTLGAEEYEMLKFDLNKKQAAENEPVEILTTYDTEEFGEFESSEEFYVSTTMESSDSPEDLARDVWDLIRENFFVLIALLISMFVVIISFALR